VNGLLRVFLEVVVFDFKLLEVFENLILVHHFPSQFLLKLVLAFLKPLMVFIELIKHFVS